MHLPHGMRGAGQRRGGGGGGGGGARGGLALYLLTEAYAPGEGGIRGGHGLSVSCAHVGTQPRCGQPLDGWMGPGL